MGKSPNCMTMSNSKIVSHYQRLHPIHNPIQPPFSYGFPLVFPWFSLGFPRDVNTINIHQPPGHHIALGGVGDGRLHRCHTHPGRVHREPRLVLLEVLGQVLRGLDVLRSLGTLGGKMGKPWENYRKTIGKWWFHMDSEWDVASGDDYNWQFAIEHSHLYRIFPWNMMMFQGYVKFTKGYPSKLQSNMRWCRKYP